MAKDNTVLIVGAAAAAFLLFRKQISDVFGGVGDAASGAGSGIGQAFEGAGQAVDTSLNSLASFIQGFSFGASQIARQAGATGTTILQLPQAAASQATQAVNTAGGVVNTALTNTGGILNDFLSSSRSTLSNVENIPVRFTSFLSNIHPVETLKDWISSSSQDVRRWVSSISSAPSAIKDEEPTPSSSTVRQIITSLSNSSSRNKSSSSGGRSTLLRGVTALERLRMQSIPSQHPFGF